MTSTPNPLPTAEKDVVTATINTRHPEHYVLVNERDGTRWRLTPEGRWTRDLPPVEKGQTDA